MYIREVEKKKSYNKILFSLLLVSLFIFSQELRSLLGEKMYSINVVGVTSVVLLLLNNFRKINKKKLSLFYLTIFIYVCSSFFYENKLMTIITSIIMFIIPLLLTMIEVDESTFKDIFKWTITIINILIIVITVIGILEIMFNFDINSYISQFMSNRTRELIYLNITSGENKRLYSFMGHPLYNTELYLIFFILNILDNKYLKYKTCPIWILITTVVGIALTGSKSGFILLVIVIVFLYEHNNTISKIIIVSSGMIIALKNGLFDNLIYRFSLGSLTTGRTEKWLEIQSNNLYPIKFFTGYGRGFTFEYNSYVDWASAAFEYPVKMFSLEFGVIFAIMIYIFIMIMPVIKLIKRKQYYLLYSYLIVFFDVNTFNGLSTAGDKMLLFCLFIFLILNFSNIIQKATIEFENAEVLYSLKLTSTRLDLNP